MSKKTIIATLSVFSLLGCAAATPTYYNLFLAGKPFESYLYPIKDGVTYLDIENDRTNCQVEAAQRVPLQQVVNTTPTYTTPTQTSCNRIGTQTFCNTVGGQTIGGGTYVTNVNAGLQAQVYRQCMFNKNYRHVDLPPCPDEVEVRRGPNNTFPTLSSTTCYRATPTHLFVGEY